MSISGVQQALQRIREIRERFEPASVKPDVEGFASMLRDAGRSLRMEAAFSPDSLEPLIQEQGYLQGLDPNLLKAVIKTESNFRLDAESPVGAQGLMQLMPATARALGVSDSFDPVQNIAGGSRYLKSLLEKYQSLPKALAAYNAGPGAVDKYGGIPPYAETIRYVQKVIAAYNAYSNQKPGGV